ncbi:hypothetical protein GCK32_009187 [Trichostrongylus colubriformis]|uniref:ATP-dependent DNA helicase n=1 Tax=Trichostrongylus colubriformis TaxID=6319 RepID=A0AAN8IJQ0_TRICO
MTDDHVHQGFDCELAVALAYLDISDEIDLIGKKLEEMVSPPVATTAAMDYNDHESNGQLLYESLNAKRKSATNEIIDALGTWRSRCIFIDGPGGSGMIY